MSEKLVISCSPHIRNKIDTQSIMRDVIIALLPALAASVWVFGFRALGDRRIGPGEDSLHGRIALLGRREAGRDPILRDEGRRVDREVAADHAVGRPNHLPRLDKAP